MLAMRFDGSPGTLHNDPAWHRVAGSAPQADDTAPCAASSGLMHPIGKASQVNARTARHECPSDRKFSS